MSSDKKKILILQNQILHYRKEVYNRLSKSYKVTVLHSGRPSKTESDSYEEIITPLKNIMFFKWQYNTLSLIRSGNYDVVIAMFDLAWLKNIFGLFIQGRPRYILWGHKYSQNKIINHLRNYFMKKADGNILYNGTEISRMVESGIIREKIYIAENTIHVENYKDLSRCRKNSFLYVGRAQKRKKVDQLLIAFSKIIDVIPASVTIDIVGEGEENKFLFKLADDLKIMDRVNFHGSVTDSTKLQKLFAKAFAYISPDAIGLGAQHSFAYGVPVVTIKNGFKGAEFDNLIHNKNSILYESPFHLKDVLKSFCDDPSITKRLGKNAYNLYSKEQTIDVMTHGFVAAIENISLPKNQK